VTGWPLINALLTVCLVVCVGALVAAVTTGESEDKARAAGLKIEPALPASPAQELSIQVVSSTGNSVSLQATPARPAKLRSGPEEGTWTSDGAADLLVSTIADDTTVPVAVRIRVRRGATEILDETLWGTGGVEDVVSIPGNDTQE